MTARAIVRIHTGGRWEDVCWGYLVVAAAAQEESRVTPGASVRALR